MRLTTSPLSRAECHEIWEPKPPRTLWATPGLLRDSFTVYFTLHVMTVNMVHFNAASRTNCFSVHSKCNKNFLMFCPWIFRTI